MASQPTSPSSATGTATVPTRLASADRSTPATTRTARTSRPRRLRRRTSTLTTSTTGTSRAWTATTILRHARATSADRASRIAEARGPPTRRVGGPLHKAAGRQALVPRPATFALNGPLSSVLVGRSGEGSGSGTQDVEVHSGGVVTAGPASVPS